ncbi:MAG: cyclic peptide export ABC transporter [Syntrophobacteraceae bacterium]
MEYFIYILKTHWKKMTGAAVMGTVAGSGCSALIIGLIHRQLKEDAAPEPYLPLYYFLFVIAYFVLSSCSEYLLLSISQHELCRLRLSFSRRVLGLSLRQVEKIGGANLMASLTNDVEKVATTLRQIPTLLFSGSMILGAAVYVAWLSWRLLLVTLGFMVVGGLLYRMPLFKLNLLQEYWVRLRNGWDRLFRDFHALTHGIKELLMHQERKEMFFQECLKQTCFQLRDDAIAGKTIQSIFFRFGDILYLVMLGGVLFVLAPYMSIEKEVLTGYIMAGLFILAPVGSLLNFGPNFGEAAIAVNNLKALGIPLFEETISFPRSGQTADITGTDTEALLRLEGVTYRYRKDSEDGEFKLGPMDLEIPLGGITFLTGGNGSGKTTLMKLLCGLYEPESGQIFWRGEAVTDDNRESYRQFFSVVFSDFYLFENLFGIESFSGDEKSQIFLRCLHLDHRVTIRDGKLSTIDLSQGQRKRLALLTAYLEDRPVYVFDEWASDQDPHFKNVFYREILPELRKNGKTVLVITHDDRWYDLADRVVTLSEGMIERDTRKSELGTGNFLPKSA